MIIKYCESINIMVKEEFLKKVLFDVKTRDLLLEEGYTEKTVRERQKGTPIQPILYVDTKQMQHCKYLNKKNVCKKTISDCFAS